MKDNEYLKVVKLEGTNQYVLEIAYYPIVQRIPQLTNGSEPWRLVEPGFTLDDLERLSRLLKKFVRRERKSV